MKNDRNELKDLAKSIHKTLSSSLEEIAKSLDDDGPNSLLAQGKIFTLASYIDEAQESYKACQSVDSENHESAARLALIQLKANKNKDALKTASILASKAPDYVMPEMTSEAGVSVFTILGNTLIKNDRIDDAIEAYEQAQKAAPQDTSSAGRLAQLYIAKGEPKKALAQKDSLSTNPRFRTLSSMLRLGVTSDALLPTLDIDRISSVIHLDAHGRPLFIDGEVRCAEVISNDDSWCDT